MSFVGSEALSGTNAHCSVKLFNYIHDFVELLSVIIAFGGKELFLIVYALSAILLFFGWRKYKESIAEEQNKFKFRIFLLLFLLPTYYWILPYAVHPITEKKRIEQRSIQAAEGKEREENLTNYIDLHCKLTRRSMLVPANKIKSLMDYEYRYQCEGGAIISRGAISSELTLEEQIAWDKENCEKPLAEDDTNRLKCTDGTELRYIDPLVTNPGEFLADQSSKVQDPIDTFRDLFSASDYSVNKIDKTSNGTDKYVLYYQKGRLVRIDHHKVDDVNNVDTTEADHSYIIKNGKLFSVYHNDKTFTERNLDDPESEGKFAHEKIVSLFDFILHPQETYPIDIKTIIYDYSGATKNQGLIGSMLIKTPEDLNWKWTSFEYLDEFGIEYQKGFPQDYKKL